MPYSKGLKLLRRRSLTSASLLGFAPSVRVHTGTLGGKRNLREGKALDTLSPTIPLPQEVGVFLCWRSYTLARSRFTRTSSALNMVLLLTRAHNPPIDSLSHGSYEVAMERYLIGGEDGHWRSTDHWRVK